MDESAPDLLLVVPDDLARLLVAEGLAEFHFQETRDSSLVPLLIVAAASSAVTVAAKDLTAHLLERIGKAIAAWRSRHASSGNTQTTEVTLEVTSSKRVTIALTSSTPESEVSSAIIDALQQLRTELETAHYVEDENPRGDRQLPT